MQSKTWIAFTSFSAGAPYGYSGSFNTALGCAKNSMFWWEITEFFHQISGPTIILVDCKFLNEVVQMIIIISSHLVLFGY